MGQIGNTVQNSAANSISKFGKQIGNGIKHTSKNGSISSMVQNFDNNMKQNSKTCPIINEIKNIGEGVAQSDFNKIALNTALTIGLASGGPQQIGMKSTIRNSKHLLNVGYICTANQGLIKNQKRSFAYEKEGGFKHIFKEHSISGDIIERESQILQNPYTIDHMGQSVFNHELFSQYVEDVVFAQELSEEPRAFCQMNDVGELNFGQLTSDHYLVVQRDQHNLKVEITTHNQVIPSLSGQGDKHIISHGQLDENNELNGLGKRYEVKPNYEYVAEGQFKDNKLHGFGREFQFKTNDRCIMYIGFWKHGQKHGYGKYVVNGNVKEGLFEHDQLIPEGLVTDTQYGVQTYIPLANPIAKKVDFSKYTIYEEDDKKRQVELSRQRGMYQGQ